MLRYFLCFLFPVLAFWITFSRDLLAGVFFFHSQSPLQQLEGTISESLPVLLFLPYIKGGGRNSRSVVPGSAVGGQWQRQGRRGQHWKGRTVAPHGGMATTTTGSEGWGSQPPCIDASSTTRGLSSGGFGSIPFSPTFRSVLANIY